jgi:hypothetical protein
VILFVILFGGYLMKQSSHRHSVLNDFTGLSRAAFIARKLNVAIVKRIVTVPAKR